LRHDLIATLALAVLVATWMSGCREESIETYRAPRAESGETAPKPGQPDPPASGLPTSGIQYATPNGWEPVGSDRGGFRLAAVFRIKEGETSATVTVMPLGGDGGGLRANVDRWRGQLNLPPVKDENELQSLVRSLTVSGRKASYVDLASPDKSSDKGPLRILTVIIPHGDQTWFVKMTGPASLIEKHKSTFEQFFKSLSFEGGNRG
jgi:hypothetical protein